tara:strand:+ start:2429 stop:2836 length:408 start_codon:yes stop_codon:yes gene_type:complete
MSDYNKFYDLDLPFGQMQEEKLRAMLESKGKIEVKAERDIWKTTGNIAIEIRCRGKESGLSITKADWWWHQLTVNDGDIEAMICIPVTKLKEICKEIYKKRKTEGKKPTVMGGDDNMAEMILVPLDKILPHVQNS